MKSSEYWQRRFDELEAALLRKGERYNASEVERQFKMAMAAIEKEISYWYQRLGSNNGVSAAEARRLLSADELREFHWTVEEYIKYGRTAGFTDKWMKQLENASAKAHISRLDAIKLQIQQQLEVLYGNQVDGLDRLMRDIYTEGYNRSAYTIDKGMGVHYNLASTDSGRIDTIINQPWAGDGKIFSDRLWRDKDKLVNTLQQEMTQAVTRGDKLGDAVKKIASRMNVAKSSAARLVMTESAFISGRSQRDCFKGLGVDKYEYVATLDRKTSEICQEMDGKVFDIDDYKPGTNAPPMHCWCRSCIVPYFGDDEGISGERAARDPDTGKRVMVPADMTYPEWEKKYVNMAAGAQKQNLVRENKYRIRDVKYLYETQMNPGRGKISYPSGYNSNDHAAEVKMADWLIKNFGGDIEILNEQNLPNKKTPDYLWNGKSWDLKTISTEKAADSAIRHGLKQIKGNSGGLVLDFTKDVMDEEKLISIIDRRMSRGFEGTTDILVVFQSMLYLVRRYENK